METLTNTQKNELIAKLREEAPGQFSYSTVDNISDWWKESPFPRDAVVRAGGALQAIGGYATAVAGSGAAAAGAATCLETGVSCFAVAGGLSMLGWGADNMTAGGATFVYGKQQPTVGGLGIAALTGMSPENAELTYSLFGLVPAGGAAYYLNKAQGFDVGDVINYAGGEAARNAANGLRLSTQLAYDEAGILTSGGAGLTRNAILSSREIPISGGRLTNPSVVAELTANGSKIEDWGKFTTTSIVLPNGKRSQIHYYMNRVTREVNLGINFKVKGVVE